MDTVTIAHAKEHLEDLIERARRGEDVRIVAPGGAIIKLARDPASGANQRTPKIIFGQWKGIVHIPDDKLFEPLPDDELAWLSGESSS